LSKSDRFAWPIPASRFVGSHRDYQVVDACDVVAIPAVNAESEVGAVHQVHRLQIEPCLVEQGQAYLMGNESDVTLFQEQSAGRTANDNPFGSFFPSGEESPAKN